MAVETVRDFLARLGESGLLTAAQFEQLDHRRPTLASPHQFARELVEAGLLTAFQADQLLRGEPGPFFLGPYEVLAALGRGGMGQVFKCRHRVLKRLAAVKVIRANLLNNDDSVRRFHREARAAAALKHPNVVAVYDANESDGTHFIAMEFVEGCDLARLVLRSGALSPAIACDHVRQAALGLQHAHEHGVVHRDVKPSNLVLVGPDQPDAGRVKVLDFGLARLGGDDESALTNPDHWIGTPDYMAPEQALSSRTVDIRCDIYSLGCTLFFLLTGRAAFEGDTPAHRMVARLHGPPLSLRSLCPLAPPGLDVVLGRMLARDPGERYQSPAEVAAALGPFTDCPAAPAAAPHTDSNAPTALFTPPRDEQDTVTPERTQTWHQPPPPRSSRRWPVLLGVAVTVSLLALAVLWWPRPGSPPVTGGSPADEGRLITNSIGMRLVRVPAGRFLMGSPDDEAGRGEDEGPRHEAVIAVPFYLGVYEVTQAEYEQVMGTNPSHFGPNGEEDLGPRGMDTARLPVESVSWEDAVAFCRRLSALRAEQQAGRTYRLPKEVEWEYACRAGTDTPFAFGGALTSTQANMNGGQPYGGAPRGENVRHPLPVGSFKPNAWGLHDMHGNVWEWTADRPLRYGSKEALPIDRGGRVLRGGSWFFNGANCRSAKRFTQDREQVSAYYGFRVACDETPTR